MIGFIITRHVVSELTNTYWNESYRTIRRFYPDEMIMIIDDNSQPEYITTDDDLVLTNCLIVKSEFPKAGEILPYYYFLKYKLFDKAVVLHDSVFFRKWIDFEKQTDTARFIWHFVQYATDNVEDEVGLLKLMDNNEELIKFYHQKHLWFGCFGAQTVVSYDFLAALEEKYHFTRIVPEINCRQKRYALERVIGCLLTMENRELRQKPSVFGIIYNYIQWGIPYRVYKEQAGTILKQELIKVWSER